MTDQRPDSDPAFGQLIAQALSLHRGGRLAEAEKLYRSALQTHAGRFEPNHLLGVLLHQQARSAEGVPYLERAVALDPAAAKAHNNLGAARLALGELARAAESFARAAALDDAFIDAHYNLANARVRLNEPEPAIPHFLRFIAAEPKLAEAHNNLGAAYLSLRRFEEAAASFGRALEIEPGLLHAQANLGNALLNLRRPAAVITILNKVLARDPARAEAHNDLGQAQAEMGDLPAAVASHRRALELKPDFLPAAIHLATAFRKLGRWPEALEVLRSAQKLAPEDARVTTALAMVSGQVCDWPDYETSTSHLLALAEREGGEVEPFVILPATDDPQLQMRVASAYVRQTIGAAVPATSRLAGNSGAKLNIGYLSADFAQHPVASLMVRLIELHDRQRFVVHGFSAGINDRSPLRRRIRAAFDTFTDVKPVPDAVLATLLRDKQLDILVELGGHTENGRIAALKSHPVPVQVTFLGYPGTSGAPFIDYTFVDKIVAPAGSEAFFTEQLVTLPDTFQPNDDTLPFGDFAVTRAKYGLPETGFVFCSFNNSYKINPPVFDIWMRLLRQVPGAVVWLARNNEWAMGNLRKEAEQRGIDPARLVFATRVDEHAEHLARQQLADLFLDTWPYNAHTTASEALRVGLPVLTCMGRSLASRVAGSLLQTIGLPELIAQSPDAYEAKALSLAQQPQILAGLRARLDATRTTTPLFNSNRFRRHIEAAYSEMWERSRRGEPPASFEVRPID